MRGHTRWLILACATVALIGAHTVPLYYLVTHKVVTASVAVSVLAMLLLKHLGVITPLITFVRGRFWKARR